MIVDFFDPPTPSELLRARIYAARVEEIWEIDIIKKINKKSGFAKNKYIPKNLAEYLGIPESSLLTGPEIMKKVWSKLKEKDLLYDKDKRVLRVDADTSKLFNVDMAVNQSVDPKDPNGFNFSNLKKYIKNAIGL
jgi:hypothetical protein